MRIVIAACLSLLALPASAQTAEIFIPNRDGRKTTVEAPVIQNRLAACLANANEASCTGIDIDPNGIALESATAAPTITFEVLVLDLGDGAVHSASEPPIKPTDYSAPVTPYQPLTLPAVAITIEFDFNSAAIRADQFGKLASLTTTLQDAALTGATFAVIGHTDAVGSDYYNCNLSQRRASEVTGALRAAYVQLPLYPVGFGERVLKNTYDPRAAENRRVTFLRLPDDYTPVLNAAAAVCRS